jgi:hypothetical protein
MSMVTDPACPAEIRVHMISGPGLPDGFMKKTGDRGTELLRRPIPRGEKMSGEKLQQAEKTRTEGRRDRQERSGRSA